ncbi:MAG TPA: RsmD family RNA methyltransferase [Chitinophagaceae bacterium]|nr:RsmD family RNA methyltransferase [Chitinophagaceae bacterium]
MRIIGGLQGGRKFYPPSGIPARPTTELAREGLFNILSNQLDFKGMRTLDLFCGTGSISFELASRGVSSLTLVDQDRATVRFIRETIDNLGFTGFSIFNADVFRFIRQCTDQFDFIFAGPPYALENIDRIADLIIGKKLLLPGGWFVLEHTKGYDFTGMPHFRMARHYGTTIFSIFILEPDTPS